MLPYRGAGSLRAERLREAEGSLDVYGQLGARQGAAAAAGGVPRLGDPVQGGPQPAGDVAQRVEVSRALSSLRHNAQHDDVPRSHRRNDL